MRERLKRQASCGRGRKVCQDPTIVPHKVDHCPSRSCSTSAQNRVKQPTLIAVWVVPSRRPYGEVQPSGQDRGRGDRLSEQSVAHPASLSPGEGCANSAARAESAWFRPLWLSLTASNGLWPGARKRMWQERRPGRMARKNHHYHTSLRSTLGGGLRRSAAGRS
jgi:hypothetical protein